MHYKFSVTDVFYCAYVFKNQPIICVVLIIAENRDVCRIK